MQGSSLSDQPRVSVIVEGYNESLSFDAIDTLEGLKHQTYPLNQVELVLAGTPLQAEQWSRMYPNQDGFWAVKIVGADVHSYVEMKNQGAMVATGDILAFIDSDVYPEPTWLASIVEAMKSGAQVTGGQSLFQSASSFGKDHPLMQVAASISWGGMIRTVYGNKPFVAQAFQTHNVAFRRNLFQAHPYRTDLAGRAGGHFMHKTLRSHDIPIAFVPEQRVVHSYTSLYWWTMVLHRRYGYEILVLRRNDPEWPHRWVQHTGILEPVLTALWHMLLDVPQWFKFSRFLGLGLARRICYLPLLLTMSALARGAEMLGTYATFIDPEGMKRFTAAH